MITRALDKNHDLFVDASSIALIANVDEIVQHIKTRMWMFLGEWILDVNAGVPWFQIIFEKPTDLLEVEIILKNTILRTANVKSLLAFDMNYNKSNRTLDISFSCNTDFGETGIEVIAINV